MDSVDSFLLSFIFSGFPRGSVFFAEDLEPSGLSPDVIRFSLSRLVTGEHGLVRLARGVYCIPEQGAGDSPGALRMPSPEILAAHLARRWKVRIAPCGEHAAFLAGFPACFPRPYTYVSDGSEQVFHLANGAELRFLKRRSLKVFRFSSEAMRNLSEGMRWFGKDYFKEPEGREVVSRTLLRVPDGEFLHDLPLCPGWIREILRELR